MPLSYFWKFCKFFSFSAALFHIFLHCYRNFKKYLKLPKKVEIPQYLKIVGTVLFNISKLSLTSKILRNIENIRQYRKNWKCQNVLKCFKKESCSIFVKFDVWRTSTVFSFSKVVQICQNGWNVENILKCRKCSKIYLKCLKTFKLRMMLQYIYRIRHFKDFSSLIFAPFCRFFFFFSDFLTFPHLFVEDFEISLFAAILNLWKYWKCAKNVKFS